VEEKIVLYSEHFDLKPSRPTKVGLDGLSELLQFWYRQIPEIAKGS
jgi:hypothetical protein